MISVNNKTFYLNGKDYTYAIFVNEAGYLQHAYYGKKIGSEVVDYTVSQVGEKFEPKKDDFNADMRFNSMPSECGFFGRGDFREATVIVQRSDGACMSRLRYKSHSIYNGVPKLNGMPHARSGGQTLAITLSDDFSPTEIVLNYTVWDDLDVLVRNIEINNMGNETIKIKKVLSFCYDLYDSEFKFLQFCGDWGKERTPVIAPVHCGITKIQSLRGISSHQTNPFCALLRNDCTETYGECYGVQLIYSGSYTITAESSTYDPQLRVQGGINDTGFEWLLESGKSFVTPQAALCYSNAGLGNLSRSYADFLRQQIINPKYVYKSRPIVVNNWEATHCDFNNDNLIPIIDAAAELGIDTFVLDDGWFGKRDDDKSGLGDWFVNENKLKGGLKFLIDRCKRHGLKFGLWIEPEMVSEDSDLYRTHPDWAIGKIGIEPSRQRNQLVLDFTDKDIVDYIYNAVEKILSDNDISYVKWDMNRSLTEYFSNRLDSQHQGEFIHRYVLGVYDLAERLTKRFPNVLFEGCSAGGARFDAGMLYYFPQIWTSDNTDAFERAKIQWGTSVCYPVSAMSCHVSACPNEQTGRTVPLKTRGAIASLGATGYELDLSKLTDDEKALVKQQIKDYKQIEELVLSGDLYRLSNPFMDDFFCQMLVNKDKTYAYAVGERLRGVKYEYDRFIKLSGLNSKARYVVKELGVETSGGALMQIGLSLPKMGDYDSWVWHIEKI